jgi:hypothetical protein
MASMPYVRVRFGLPAVLAAAAGAPPAATTARFPSYDIHFISAVAPRRGANGVAAGTIARIGPRS